MKKLICMLSLIFYMFNLSAQNELSNNNDSTEVVIKAISIKELREKFINSYVDSLNSITQFQSVPRFFLDYKFDKEKTYYWKSSHHPHSLRKMIIDRIVNKKLLVFIKDSSNPNLKKVLNLWSIPYSKISTYELVIKQLKQLNK